MGIRRLSRGDVIVNCRFVVGRDGSITETTSGSYRVCRSEGVTYGRNAKAKEQSLQDVKDFVTRVFKLSEPTR